MRWILDREVMKAHQARHIEDAVVHLTPLGAPRYRGQQFAQQVVGAAQPSGADVDPGPLAQRPPFVALEQRLLYRNRHGADSIAHPFEFARRRCGPCAGPKWGHAPSPLRGWGYGQSNYSRTGPGPCLASTSPGLVNAQL